MNKKYTVEELNQCSKETLIALFLSMQAQMERLNQNIEHLVEQVALSNQKRFGRSSEKMEIKGQLSLQECFQECFNEAEAITENLYILEPELEQVCPKPYKRKKYQGQREEELNNLPVTVISHELSEKELKKIFGEKWKRLPDEVYKRLAFHPASFEVEEHHVAVYAGVDNETMVKAKRPASLLRNSIVTPSLETAILNAKYVNAIPLYRLEQEFKRKEVKISRQVMANWTIECAQRYLWLVYDRLHQELYKSPVLQVDETPVLVTKDGRPAGSKSYMWVYRTGKFYEGAPIVLYEYQRTRNTSHPREFLKNYTGTCVTDGYQVYHTLEKEREELRVAGCWSHARRRFANVVKAVGKEKAKGTLAYDALKQIGAIYQIEETLSQLSSQERQQQRHLSVKPLVEAFFLWIKEHNFSESQ